MTAAAPESPLRLTALAATGGAFGAVIRHLITLGTAELPWTTLVINVTGCALLALLPTSDFVRRSRAWSVFLGTGVLGGYTTMSAAVVLPVARFSPILAAAYLAATLVACLSAVALVRAFTHAWPDREATL